MTTEEAKAAVAKINTEVDRCVANRKALEKQLEVSSKIYEDRLKDPTMTKQKIVSKEKVKDLEQLKKFRYASSLVDLLDTPEEEFRYLTESEVLDFLDTPKRSYYIYPNSDTQERRFVIDLVLRSKRPLSTSDIGLFINKAGLDYCNYINRLNQHLAQDSSTTKIKLVKIIKTNKIKYYH